MSKLLEKARRLTIKERKALAEKGIYLTNLDPSKDEEAGFMIMDMLYTEKEQESIDSAEMEQEIWKVVLQKTYGLEESEAKN